MNPRRWWSTMMPKWRGKIVVLEVERTVVGYMVAWPESDAYFIENIGVDTAIAGQRSGRRLMDHAATEAAHLGLPALRSTPMRR